jgi:hypothetical protein
MKYCRAAARGTVCTLMDSAARQRRRQVDNVALVARRSIFPIPGARHDRAQFESEAIASTVGTQAGAGGVFVFAGGRRSTAYGDTRS